MTRFCPYCFPIILLCIYILYFPAEIAASIGVQQNTPEKYLFILFGILVNRPSDPYLNNIVHLFSDVINTLARHLYKCKIIKSAIAFFRATTFTIRINIFHFSNQELFIRSNVKRQG